MLKNPIADFIEAEQISDWFAQGMSFYHCKFNKNAYDDSLFEHLGIHFSSSLNKAIAKRRAEFLAGRYCAEQSLRRLGFYHREIKIGADRNPLWPEGVLGSISHCGNYAVAVTSNDAEILGLGIDIEDEVDADTMGKIQQQILSDAEISLISEKAGDISLLFTLAFSMKESFFKAAYPLVQQYFDFDAISITDIDQENRTISFKITSSLHEKLPQDLILQGSFHILPDKQIVTLVVLQ